MRLDLLDGRVQFRFEVVAKRSVFIGTGGRATIVQFLGLVKPNTEASHNSIKYIFTKCENWMHKK